MSTLTSTILIGTVGLICGISCLTIFMSGYHTRYPGTVGSIITAILIGALIGVSLIALMPLFWILR